ncbi:hypothetical protein MferCBS31731_007033 [Microsporum ferrugineum]
MSYSSSEEPPLLEYARFHGIAVNNLQLDPGEVISGLLSADSCTTDLNESFIEDDRKAQELVEAVHSEKLPSSRASGELLSSVVRAQNEYIDSSKDRSYASKTLPDRQRVEQLKIYPPILTRDTARSFLSIPPLPLLGQSDIHVPLEKLNDEHDEGLAFPGYYADMRSEIMGRISKEKVVCQPTAGLYLQEALRYQQYEGSLQYKKPTYFPSLNENIDNFKLCPRIFVNEDGHKDGSLTKQAGSTLQETPLSEISGYLLPTLFSASESVSSFMEVNGREKLPNTGRDSDPNSLELHPSPNTTQAGQIQNRECHISSDFPHQAEANNIPLDAPPSYDDVSVPGVLFLSTDLIKSHGPLIHKLETLPSPPTLMFYELSPPSVVRDVSWRDADITLSPRVGVLLATIKDYTQLHLPGHLTERFSDIELNSPFQERVYQTCKKYDLLYIFTLYATESTTTQSSVSVDKRTYGAITSVGAFCDALSRYSKVSVLNISSELTTLTQWIINLGKKHHVSVPRPDLRNILGRTYNLPFQPYFCPSEVKSIPEAMDEQFLTQRLGLNCFAAHFVMYILSPTLQGANQVLVTEIPPGQISRPVREQLLLALHKLCGETGKAYIVPLLGERAFSRILARIHGMKVSPMGVN